MKILIQITLAIIILALIPVTIQSCKNEGNRPTETGVIFDETGGESIKIIEIDGCEYIKYISDYKGSIAHKGNCKFCAERNKITPTKESNSEFWWRD